MGCTVTMVEEKHLSTCNSERPSYKRQFSLSELESFLRITIEKGLSGKNSESNLRTKKQLESAGQSPNDRLPVYGRICTTKNADTAPVKLSDVPDRKTAFLFGPETVYGALLENIHDPYTMLLRLGFLPEYIHLKACKQKACYWLILLTPDQESIQSTSTPVSPQSPGNIPPVPATWEGLLSFIQVCYPEALPAVQAHWDLIKSKPVSYFEEKSNVKFIDALTDPRAPAFMSYLRFQTLPKPQKDWETRLFLYCEVRIFELFSGDGHTWSEAGVKGEKEYLSLNYEFETDLGRDNYISIPLKVVVPQEVRDRFGK